MDPVTIGMIGASVLPSIIGMFQGDDSEKYIQQAIAELIKVHIPDPEQQKLALQRYQMTGELDPKLESAIQQDPSAFEQVVQNQKYVQAQDRALGQLQSLGEEGGLSLSDRANLEQELMTSANKDRANRDAITDDMARRGQLGSGMALQAQVGGAQAAGDRNAMARLSALGGAQDRALQSIMGAGDLAGKMGQQDYAQKSDLASARDRISQFNTQNAQSVQQRNVAGQNAAQTYNLDRKQDIANRNTDLSNDEQRYNKELYQKQFDNQMQKSGAMANAYTGAANQSQQAGAQKRQSYGAIGSGIGQLGGAIQNQNNWDSWLETIKQKKPKIAGESYTDYSGYA